MSGFVYLSVVIPAYNEAGAIQKVIEDHAALLGQLKGHISEWEIVCLDDASRDDTHLILKKLAETIPQLKVMRHSVNQGIQTTFFDLYQAAEGELIYATGGDGQWPPENLKRMLEGLIGQHADFVIGVRTNRQQIYSRMRQIVSFCFNLLPKILFGVDTRDAGSAKLGRREVFRMPVISKSSFAEAERIIRAQKSGYQIHFVPIQFISRASGKETGAKWKNVWQSFEDCLKVFFLGNSIKQK